MFSIIGYGLMAVRWGFTFGFLHQMAQEVIEHKFPETPAEEEPAPAAAQAA